MAAPRALPDSGTLRRLRRKHTYREIATMYGVSETAVYLRIRNDAPDLLTPAPRYAEYLPWRVRTDHTWAPPAKYLRLLARRDAGQTLPPASGRNLDNWLARLRATGCVVDYDPEAPPNEASPTYGGFFFVLRQPADGDGWIRRPDPDSR